MGRVGVWNIVKDWCLCKLSKLRDRNVITVEMGLYFLTRMGVLRDRLFSSVLDFLMRS
jgi:hypothetical protein